MRYTGIDVACDIDGTNYGRGDHTGNDKVDVALRVSEFEVMCSLVVGLRIPDRFAAKARGQEGEVLGIIDEDIDALRHPVLMMLHESCASPEGPVLRSDVRFLQGFQTAYRSIKQRVPMRQARPPDRGSARRSSASPSRIRSPAPHGGCHESRRNSITSVGRTSVKKVAT